jgi:hypothetical protein
MAVVMIVAGMSALGALPKAAIPNHNKNMIQYMRKKKH